MLPISEALALATRHWQAGRRAAAETICRVVLDAAPDSAPAHYLWGQLAWERGDGPAAEEHLRRAVQLDPENIEYLTLFSAALCWQERFAESVAWHERLLALAAHPSPRADNNHGIALQRLGRYAEAEAAYRRALAVQADHVPALVNLAAVLEKLGRLVEAETALRRALELDPDVPDGRGALGHLLVAQGRAAEGFLEHSAAVRLRPHDAGVHSKALLAEQYVPGVTLAQLAASHRQWEERHAVGLAATPPPVCDRDPDRPLRLGFVSQDLGVHPVGRLLWGSIAHLDRREFPLVYYNDRAAADDLTRRIAGTASLWRDVWGLSDADLARQITADRIDILFDLDGHTSNRLLVFARRPAPLQMAWLGYPGTTGLGAIDYLVADGREVPESLAGHYRESILRLPDGYLCYGPSDAAPAVGPLPAAAEGRVTFGSFNNLAKINAEVVGVWSQILRRVPGARLLLKAHGLDDPQLARRYRRLFADEGLDPQRLLLEGAAEHAALLARYAAVDVALDPLPYNGGLTTCEALWMGVPVVTCPGQTFAGRHGLSHLSSAGLSELIAADLEDYVAIAVRLVADLDGLAEFRRQLRPKLAASALCDGPRFARDFAAQLRGAWRQAVAIRP